MVASADSVLYISRLQSDRRVLYTCANGAYVMLHIFLIEGCTQSAGVGCGHCGRVMEKTLK